MMQTMMERLQDDAHLYLADKGLPTNTEDKTETDSINRLVKFPQGTTHLYVRVYEWKLPGFQIDR